MFALAKRQSRPSRVGHPPSAHLRNITRITSDRRFSSGGCQTADPVMVADDTMCMNICQAIKHHINRISSILEILAYIHFDTVFRHSPAQPTYPHSTSTNVISTTNINQGTETALCNVPSVVLPPPPCDDGSSFVVSSILFFGLLRFVSLKLLFCDVPVSRVLPPCVV